MDHSPDCPTDWHTEKPAEFNRHTVDQRKNCISVRLSERLVAVQVGCRHNVAATVCPVNESNLTDPWGYVQNRRHKTVQVTMLLLDAALASPQSALQLSPHFLHLSCDNFKALDKGGLPGGVWVPRPDPISVWVPR